jgi:hypothetical protein
MTDQFCLTSAIARHRAPIESLSWLRRMLVKVNIVYSVYVCLHTHMNVKTTGRGRDCSRESPWKVLRLGLLTARLLVQLLSSNGIAWARVNSLLIKGHVLRPCYLLSRRSKWNTYSRINTFTFAELTVMSTLAFVELCLVFCGRQKASAHCLDYNSDNWANLLSYNKINIHAWYYILV